MRFTNSELIMLCLELWRSHVNCIFFALGHVVFHVCSDVVMLHFAFYNYTLRKQPMATDFLLFTLYTIFGK